MNGNASSKENKWEHDRYMTILWWIVPSKEFLHDDYL